MGQKGKTKVEKEFSWSKVITMYDDLFQQQCTLAKKIKTSESESRQAGFWSFFSHYCSQEITPDTRLVLTPKGKAILSGQIQPFHFLDQPWHKETLERISFSSDPEGKPVAALLNVVESDPAGPADLLHRSDALSAILWMLKRNWLAVC